MTMLDVELSPSAHCIDSIGVSRRNAAAFAPALPDQPNTSRTVR
jgi:hypothetical protein